MTTFRFKSKNTKNVLSTQIKSLEDFVDVSLIILIALENENLEILNKRGGVRMIGELEMFQYNDNRGGWNKQGAGNGSI